MGSCPIKLRFETCNNSLGSWRQQWVSLGSKGKSASCSSGLLSQSQLPLCICPLLDPTPVEVGGGVAGTMGYRAKVCPRLVAMCFGSSPWGPDGSVGLFSSASGFLGKSGMVPLACGLGLGHHHRLRLRPIVAVKSRVYLQSSHVKSGPPVPGLIAGPSHSECLVAWLRVSDHELCVPAGWSALTALKRTGAPVTSGVLHEGSRSHLAASLEEALVAWIRKSFGAQQWSEGCHPLCSSGSAKQTVPEVTGQVTQPSLEPGQLPLSCSDPNPPPSLSLLTCVGGVTPVTTHRLP